MFSSLRRQVGAWVDSFPGPYTTPRSVYVYDTRLRYCQLAALTIVVVVVVFEVLLLHKDSVFEVPLGNVNSWSTFEDLPLLPDDAPKPIFCDNSTYNWVPVGSDTVVSGGIYSINNSCPDLNPSNILRLSDSGVSAKSWASRVLINYTCPDGVGRCHGRSSPRESYFFQRVEDLPILFIHSYSTSWGDARSNVQSRILNHHGEVVHEFAAGFPVGPLTVGEYIRLSARGIRVMGQDEMR